MRTQESHSRIPSSVKKHYGVYLYPEDHQKIEDLIALTGLPSRSGIIRMALNIVHRHLVEEWAKIDRRGVKR